MKSSELETDRQNFRPACGDDVSDVCRLAQAVKIDPRLAQAEVVNDGFLIYALDEEGYKKRLNDFFLVSQDDKGLAGFFMCYDKEKLDQLIESGEIGHEDGIMDFLSSSVEADNFVFGDQIVVDHKNRSDGVGTAMMAEVFTKMKEKGIADFYAAILHQPLKNEASIAFTDTLGLKNVGEVTNADGLVWGMYHLGLE